MRSGGAHAKGASYERKIAQQLSLWVTEGKVADGLWRTSMSGGRATIALRRGEKLQQVGDLSAIRPELHPFSNKYFIECKHVRSLDLESFILSGKGTLAKFWQVAQREANAHGRIPIIIARQNRTPDLVLVHTYVLKSVIRKPLISSDYRAAPAWEIWLLSDLLEQSYASTT